MASSFKFDATGILKGLSNMQSKADLAIEGFADTGSQKLESAAKENARWQNRTGHARQRLKGGYSKVVNGYELSLAHGVDYGIWLELANEKRYAIIMETVEYVGTFDIMPAFEKLLDRLKA